GKIIFGNGSFLFFAVLIFGKLLPRFFPSLRIKLQGDNTQQLISNVLQITLDKIENVLLITGAILMLIGGLVLLTEKFAWPKKSVQPQQPESTEPLPPPDDSALTVQSETKGGELEVEVSDKPSENDHVK